MLCGYVVVDEDADARPRAPNGQMNANLFTREIKDAIRLQLVQKLSIVFRPAKDAKGLILRPSDAKTPTTTKPV